VPLQAPELDDRTYDQLVSEMRLRIPRYTLEWTDFNDSDPGMTLVQLFAWLTEMILYRMNQVPDRNYIKFMQLLNYELKAAQPAVAHLTFSPRPGANVGSVPKRAQIAAQPAAGGNPLIFETQAGLDVIPAPLTAVQVFNGSTFSDARPRNDAPGVSFAPLGWQPQVNSALYLGFDPAELPAGLAPFPSQLRFRAFLPADAPAARVVSCNEARQPPPPPVSLVWEYKPSDTALSWRRLNVIQDESAAFTREGYIRLEGPPKIAPSRVTNQQDPPLLWLRCRLTSGRYPAGHEPVIDMIRPNTVPAENLSTIAREIVGESEGTPDQSFTLENIPVQPGSLTLTIQIADQPPESWERVDDFLASDRRARHYVFSPATGVIKFGDGKRGQIPPAGAEIVAVSYRWGGGEAGNVPAGAINAPLGSLVGIERVTNERAAAGGGNEQAIKELKESMPRRMRSRDRAVTAEDYAALASEAGGVARATAIALAHPDHPDVQAPGAITVVIVPDNEDPKPEPSVDLLQAVCRYLDERRLLTTEIYVKAPQYQKVKVEARVAADPYAAPGIVRQGIVDALNTYLDPLGRRAGAPRNEKRGQCWPFGQSLFPTNLYNTILDVAGVRAVEHLAVQVDNREQDINKPVQVPPDGLLFGDEHDITVVPYQDS
jgi:predicted phage baseplate assembly protein